ncbi:MAG: SUMF1/EgtB/PvdO family nonheme iron enzyme [Pirellulales bacterium]|nr:SUMF1/EgtB/PvdO family nonheme iron enzyme [Pirellulales bacterium]
MPKPVANPQAEAADQAGMKRYVETIPGTGVVFEMVPVPGGIYKMGSPPQEKGRKDDEGPQHEVQIDPFWMEAHEVTWQEYELWAMGLDQLRRKHGTEEIPSAQDQMADALARPSKPYSDMTFGMGKKNFPAICMTQFAAKIYCKWLSAKTGRYYRLPTEAEWEYACRAGSSSAYCCGDDPQRLGDYAWYGESDDGDDEGNSDEQYQQVAKKKPNAWGLYDMHGNVSEWCLDQYQPDAYRKGSGRRAQNPLIPSTKPYPHVVRGGSWLEPPEACRSAARRGSTKDWKSQDPQIPQSIWYLTDADFVGFRVVRPLKTPTAKEAARYDLTPLEKEEFQTYQKSRAGKQ